MCLSPDAIKAQCSAPPYAKHLLCCNLSTSELRDSGTQFGRPTLGVGYQTACYPPAADRSVMGRKHSPKILAMSLQKGNS